MAGRCPGQDGRQLSVSIHKCPSCGNEVEMFSDETRVRCPACKTPVIKEEVPSCVQWCSQARECLGEVRWKELMDGAGAGGTGDRGADVGGADADGEGSLGNTGGEQDGGANG